MNPTNFWMRNQKPPLLRMPSEIVPCRRFWCCLIRVHTAGGGKGSCAAKVSRGPWNSRDMLTWCIGHGRSSWAWQKAHCQAGTKAAQNSMWPPCGGPADAVGDGVGDGGGGGAEELSTVELDPDNRDAIVLNYWSRWWKWRRARWGQGRREPGERRVHRLGRGVP